MLFAPLRVRLHAGLLHGRVNHFADVLDDEIARRQRIHRAQAKPTAVGTLQRGCTGCSDRRWKVEGKQAMVSIDSPEAVTLVHE